ncbi:hypothetical protein C2I18_08580 [Paenibacillus sp. PK3_47]|uniref:PQQ-binding-like beta-propeller repeat protein n=1 Tax=Paenibacillus sp. PK3_47 TaxID=2072642 RepID=UPI00201D8ED6|nr:PQQ-binding-like beta-propeller repeat protein [Paenibacillus sp. PK3_47]UQZ33594.1 hypothetical protein C2I18_08580 [Paenibacillus sp. PK3_47]
MWSINVKNAAFTAVIGLSMLVAASSVQSAAYDPHTSYIGNNFSEPYTELPGVKAAWSADIDLQSDEYATGRGSIAAGGGKVYGIQKGQLVAFNVQNGKAAWRQGSKLTAPILYRDGVLFAGSQTGTLYAVEAANGKIKWKSAVPGKAVTQLVADQNQLLAFSGDIQAYSLKDGKFQWKDNYSEGLQQPIQVQGNLVLAGNTVSGAYSYELLHAFDRTTGKQVWDSGNHSLPVAAGSGTLISLRTANLMELVPLTTLDTLDAKTGKVLKSAEYNPLNINPVDALSSGGRAWISDNRVYINGGPTVYSYPANADPQTATKTAYSVAGTDKTFTYAAGPYDGRILFSNGESVYGIKTANQGLVTYYGGGKIARFDLLGHGMYIALTDGRIIAMNLLTGAALLQLKTTGPAYGPTLQESGMILVQSKGKVTAFQEPASLKVK